MLLGHRAQLANLAGGQSGLNEVNRLSEASGPCLASEFNSRPVGPLHRILQMSSYLPGPQLLATSRGNGSRIT